MVSFPNCKINIGLRAINKRADGFHNIESIFYPVALKDAIEIIEDKNGQTSFSQTGITVPGNIVDNLCMKAYRLLKDDFPQLPNVKIHLHKKIPIGAGLGGGSANASFILSLANQKFDLQLSNEQLLNYALQLGSDCPFFIINKPCYATGRGEILEEIPLDLSAYKILLVYPGIHINTGWAFSNINVASTANDLKGQSSKPIEEWQHTVRNEFEEPVFKAYPEISEIKKTLLAGGAIYASMSGSGSTVFGIFKKEETAPFNFPAKYVYYWV